MLRAVIQLDIFAASGIRIGEQLVNDDFSWEDRFEFIWDRRLFWTLRGLIGIVRIFRLSYRSNSFWPSRKFTCPL